MVSLFFVFVGAGLGACLRWWLGLTLNHLFPTIPLGTLAANLLGGFLIGAATAWFSLRSGLPPEARLFLVTGLLGGLTTFSTFSAEVVTLFLREQYGWAVAAAGLHLTGSLALTVLGMFVARRLLAA